jgi:hypothetical protein
MRGVKKHFGLLVGILGLAACASNTSFSNTWRDPSVKSIKFTKVLAVAITREEGMRRGYEDEMVNSIDAGGRATGIASYSLFTTAELQDTAQAQAKATANGVDGMVTMKVVGVDKETRYEPGSVTVVGGPGYGYGYGAWGYYGGGWATAYSTPGYTVTDKYVQVETHIYSLPDGKLIWAGRSETVNPESVAGLVDETGEAIRKELHEEGLLAN